MSHLCGWPLAVSLWLSLSKLVNLSNIVTARAVDCWKVVNELPNLSNTVTAGANARLLGVGKYGRAGGLLQKPALPPWSHLSREAGLAPGKVCWRNFDQP